MRKSLTVVVAFLGLACAGFAEEERRILSIGGTVTEIIFELEGQDELVGRDTTSSFPAEAMALPDIGYMRTLAPESALSVAPTLIIAEEGAGPKETIDTLKSSGIEYVEVPEGYTANAIVTKISIVGKAIDREEEAEELAAKVTSQIEAAKVKASEITNKKRVLFVLTDKTGELQVGGADTSADAIIELAGGINVAKEIAGYKSMTNEAIIAANPDVIIMMDREGVEDDYQSVLKHPAVLLTNAGKEQALITMDGLLMLGFGPRTGEAITELSELLYEGKS